MKVINAYWEISNLGKKTVEIFIENNTEINQELHDIISNYEYVVVKVKVGEFSIIKQLESMGFNYIETMISLSATEQNLERALNSNGIKIYDEITYCVDNSQEAIKRVVEQVQSGMFNSDRISLDSEFGEQIAQKRYVNWIKSSIEDGTNNLVLIKYKNNVIGFTMYNEKNDSVNFPLSGIFKEYRGLKLGSSIVSTQKNIIKKIKKDAYIQISVNNIPSLRTHILGGYNIIGAINVFIKHQ